MAENVGTLKGKFKPVGLGVGPLSLKQKRIVQVNHGLFWVVVQLAGHETLTLADPGSNPGNPV